MQLIDVGQADQYLSTITFKHRIIKKEIRALNKDILAEDIIADRDFPPFDRVAMDGIAIRFKDFENGQRTFPILAIQSAGQEPIDCLLASCVEVMTGAMLPKNADTIIPYEDIEIKNSTATTNRNIRVFQNIHAKGKDIKKGAIILQKGRSIDPAAVAILATVGKNEVAVYKKPMMAIISTGDEIITDFQKVPKPFQIRLSNSYMIASVLKDYSSDIQFYHLSDDKEEIRKALGSVLDQYDIVILTGGVSKGKFDYIPEVLKELNVEKIFHGIRQRPGKPMWLGKTQLGKPVFALPGNPVSSLLCTCRYIKSWIERHFNWNPNPVRVQLLNDVSFTSDLTYFALCATYTDENGQRWAKTITTGGSGDMISLSQATGFIELPRGQNIYRASQFYNYYPFNTNIQ